MSGQSIDFSTDGLNNLIDQNVIVVCAPRMSQSDAKNIIAWRETSVPTRASAAAWGSASSWTSGPVARAASSLGGLRAHVSGLRAHVSGLGPI